LNRLGRSAWTKLLTATAVAGVVLSPALAAEGKRAPAVSVSLDPASGFTPAVADPRLAAAFAGKAPSLTDFKFTPAAAKSRPSQVRVAIRAKANTPAKVRVADVSSDSSSPIGAITPASYNLGVAVGWRRFAVSGDVAKVKSGTEALGGRESAVVGVSYSLNRKLTGRLAVGADRDDGRAVPALRNPDNYSLDLGGAYSLTKRIALTGGVRYSIDRDRDTTLRDNRRDSQAVYVGTAFKF
jgi:hypothetical protein